ncbi:MAG: ribonuclease H-like domain-containing protein [Deltaproteobacteria bacterium]|nr:ribonuclease H-like domain-containing protein [Deltaproteobacteria bacterium]
MTEQQNGAKSAPAHKARIRLSPSYWTHDYAVPFSEDVQPASLFLKNRHYLVVDIETQKIAQDVGGWGNIDKLGVSVACAYDSKSGELLAFRENELDALQKLCRERLVVGYNIAGFDLKVLSAYGFDSRRYDVFDIMLDVENTSGRRFVKLDSIAKGTLGNEKIADGLQAVEWYKRGEIDKIIEYCKRDVEITRDIFIYGMKNGHIKIAMADGGASTVPVQWT